MFIKRPYLRASAYLRRHGLKSTVQRAWRELDIQLRRNRCVMFWMDLRRAELAPAALPEGFRVERHDSSSEVPERTFNRIAELYSEELMRGSARHRFDLGAHLWCLMNGTEEVGYIWTVEGRSMKASYFFPLQTRDIHFDDGLIFPPYRGRGLLGDLNRHILRCYKEEGYLRAFLEVHEWNASSIRSVVKTGFVKFGLARKRFRRGKCLVTWWH
jgi:GNAT superfamily N-acetyltransferase